MGLLGKIRTELGDKRTSGKKVKLRKEKTGCVVCTSHKTNGDGYFRKHINGKLIMVHRHIWQRFNKREIPEGFEVDHKCRNRACINPKHLQLLEGQAHTKKTNKERYSKRRGKAKKYWQQNDVTGTELAYRFGVSVSGACKWIRSWKKST